LAVIFSSPPRALTKSWRVLTYISARRSGSLPQGLKSVRENWVVPPGLRSFFPRIIKGRPFEVGFEYDAKLYRKEHPYGH
jgi:hypothetical protein